MASGYCLPKGSVVDSCNGVASLAHQGDGNVVMYKNSSGTPLWSTGTAGDDTAILAMQGDGNLVLYGPSSEVYWYSNTAGSTGAYAAVQDDCNFVIYQGSSPIWASYQVCP
jgi:pseudomonalisin